MKLQDTEYGREAEKFFKLLESIDRPGDYCTGGKMHVPMPVVTVDGAGDLSFPVPRATIDALIGLAERAPYGKGTMTLVDPAVRDCWQIDADQVQLAGSAWQASFRKIMDLVATGLGLADAELGAKLYKMLVYRQGGFFAAHRDTEKVDGMVATLSVTLPTKGAGGELVVRHARDETVFDMRAQEPSELAFAAFYADCLHEARPITEGHRISLVFNLFIRSGKKWSGAPDYTGIEEEVKVCLAALRDHGNTGKLVWLLEHEYTEDGLSFDTLKNTDAAVAQVLGKAAESADWSMYAAVLHVGEVGDPAYDDGPGNWRMEAVASSRLAHVEDCWEYLDNWVARDGDRPNLGELSVADGEVYPPDVFEDAVPDEEKLEEYQGNYGPTLELLYRRAALVVWPKERSVDVLARSGIKKVVEWVSTQQGLMSQTEMRRMLTRLMEIWPQERREYEDHNLPKMLRLLEANGNAALAADFLSRNMLNHYDGSENAALSDLILMVGPEAAKKLLPRLVEKYMPQLPKEISSFLALVGEKLDNAGSEWRDTALNVGRLAFANLGAALEAGSDAIVRAEAYRLSKENASYISSTEVERLSMDQAAIRELFMLGWRLGLAEESVKAAGIIGEFPKAVPPDRILPAMLAGSYTHGDLASTESYRLLWRQAVDFLVGRSSAPPSEPDDWMLDAKIPDHCELCTSLRTFCLDPEAIVFRFKVNQGCRRHLREVIDRHHLELDHVTERKGSPYTLVCTKNRASFKRRLREYTEDVQAIGLLQELVPKDALGGSEAERLQRLELAVAAARRT